MTCPPVSAAAAACTPRIRLMALGAFLILMLVGSTFQSIASESESAAARVGKAGARLRSRKIVQTLTDGATFESEELLGDPFVELDDAALGTGISSSSSSNIGGGNSNSRSSAHDGSTGVNGHSGVLEEDDAVATTNRPFLVISADDVEHALERKLRRLDVPVDTLQATATWQLRLKRRKTKQQLQFQLYREQKQKEEQALELQSLLAEAGYSTTPTTVREARLAAAKLVAAQQRAAEKARAESRGVNTLAEMRMLLRAQNNAKPVTKTTV